MNKKAEIALHVAAWIIIFFTPMMYNGHNESIDVRRYLCFSVAPMMLAIVFYANYFHLIERFLLNGGRKQFVIYNIVMILSLSMLLHIWIRYSHHFFLPDIKVVKQPRHPLEPYVFIIRDSFNMRIACVMATTIRLSRRIHQAEDARKEAELKTLRAQINPHFLLNTLNNIYALTAIDCSRAQKAIDELSRILRHVLYDNERPFIPIAEEIKFLNDYVSLMRIRLSSNVEVRFNADIADDCRASIAPMIFISLVENAFKHGVSANDNSHVFIDIHADNQTITCHIRNSNNPKPKSDHSGHGIGLSQVEKRLELTYTGKYKWKQWTDNNEYNSKIIIYDTKMCNN